ncbi:MAG: hypothetical protein RLO09_12350 [Cyclobacteriaceae bacterium]
MNSIFKGKVNSQPVELSLPKITDGGLLSILLITAYTIKNKISFKGE